MNYYMFNCLSISIIPPRATKADVMRSFLVLTAFTERQWEPILPESVVLMDTVLSLNNLTILDAVVNLGLV